LIGVLDIYWRLMIATRIKISKILTFKIGGKYSPYICREFKSNQNERII
jgi:hypothetical protein